MNFRSAFAQLRRRRWIVIGSAAAAVVAATAVVVVTVVLPATASSSEETITTTAIASLETLDKSVSTSGTLSPLVNEEVSFAVSGTVTKVAVEEGDTVEAGDTLATVDTLSLDAALLQAKADLASAEAKLSNSSDESDGSTADLAQISANAAAVEVAEAAVEDAEDAVDDATLTAPAAGVITAVAVEVGDSVGSAAGGASAAAFTIVGTDAWAVDVTVGEADVALLAVGNQVELATDDGVAFFGVVSEVGMLPSTDTGAAAYPVSIDVTGTAEGLFDGISVTAEIIYERRTDVLTVSSAAVTTDGETSTVTVITADGEQVVTTVEVGETVGTLTEIISGIAEGDEVLVATFTPGEGNAGTTGGFPEGFTGNFEPGTGFGTGERPDFGGQAPGQ
ncbi:efflux RND transporter periplasmic adaptor subunit [uncultured Schumannella sp.]|uniref:efflux RND transporter periplasmic adaptor subunit n=1 Tax=uncultured Schumannella sp. TaxID=1195956 RepID=UPI0025EF5A83|nr:efflux RND transporter periplasmic adaptor subunit [uncultured Schumannella sp.]